MRLQNLSCRYYHELNFGKKMAEFIDVDLELDFDSE